MSNEIKSTKHYALLKKFTTEAEEVFKKDCLQKYGEEVCRLYIFPYLDDMLECVSCHVEDLAEQSVEEEELNYGNEGEIDNEYQ